MPTPSIAKKPGISFGTILKIFTSWRMTVTLLLGFSSGIPLALTASTLQAWMQDKHINIQWIGLFSLVGLPYTFKFIWAPIMDRFTPPFLGHRRGWLLITQAALIASIAAMSFSHPAKDPMLLAIIAVLVAFSSASQDIVIDAYRTDLLPTEEYGIGASLYILGYRAAMLTSGAIALAMADHMSWEHVYLVMAGTILVGVVTTIFAPVPNVDAPPPKNIKEAYVAPLFEFFKRSGAFEILVFLIIYKIDVALTTALTTPFMMQIGFTKTQIAEVTKAFGMGALMVGAILGGSLMVKIGIERSLWLFGILQAFSGLAYMWLAHVGYSMSVMALAVGVENFCSGLSTSAFTAFMMSLCDKRFTATQFALITSFMALSRYVAAAPSGFLVNAVGWQHYFLICAFAGVPGLLLLTRFKKWTIPAIAET